MQPQERIATDNQTRWAIDPTHSTVEFAIKKLFFFVVKGSLTIVEGSLVLDSADVSRHPPRSCYRRRSINTGNKRVIISSCVLRVSSMPNAIRKIVFKPPRWDREPTDTLSASGWIANDKESSTSEIVLDVSEIDPKLLAERRARRLLQRAD